MSNDRSRHASHASHPKKKTVFFFIRLIINQKEIIGRFLSENRERLVEIVQ